MSNCGCADQPCGHVGGNTVTVPVVLDSDLKAICQAMRVHITSSGCECPQTCAELCHIIKAACEFASMCGCHLTNGLLAYLAAAFYIRNIATSYAITGNVSDGTIQFSGATSATQLRAIAKEMQDMVMACCKPQQRLFGIAKMGKAACVVSKPLADCGCRKECGCGKNKNVLIQKSKMNCAFDCCEDCYETGTKIIATSG